MTREEIINALEDRLQTTVTISRVWRGWQCEAKCTKRIGAGFTEQEAADDLLVQMGLEKR